MLSDHKEAILEEFQKFLKGLTNELTAKHRDLSGVEVTVTPVEGKKTHTVRVAFEFARPRTGHPHEDIGGCIKGYFEPGFFRRRQIRKFLTRTVRFGLNEFKFFNPRGVHGIDCQRTYRESSHSLASSWFVATIYFDSPSGITAEFPLFPKEEILTAKDFGITIPDPEWVWA